MDINFKNIYFYKKKIKRIIFETAKTVFENHNIDDYSVSFLITNNKNIAEINNDFRNLDKPTDVLSFPSTDDFSGDIDNFYGDIIISVQRARKQAKELDQTFSRELAFLTVHGCLHLLGYDHIEKTDESVMIEKQRMLMQIIEANSVIGDLI